MTKRFISRHRLQKKDPAAAVSEPVEPIVYYLDRGTPEPIRSALLDGARWWNQAFEAAGYRNAFRVELLPEGADPLDVRYNVIQWVHRSTRGWSYGATVDRSAHRRDHQGPRHARIAARAAGLPDRRRSARRRTATATETPPEMERMALARLRQLVGARGRPHARLRPQLLRQHAPGASR